MANGLWVDPRREIWAWPLSAIVIIGLTGLFFVFPFLIYLGGEGVGASTSRKLGVTILSGFFFLLGLYVCVGIYQVFAHEIRKLFIVRKVEWFGDHLELRGYYFKQDAFAPEDIERIDEHCVSRRFGKNIATALSHRRHNYKITLKDGREYYLPGDMTDIDELKTLLASKLSEH